MGVGREMEFVIMMRWVLIVFWVFVDMYFLLIVIEGEFEG